MNGYFSYVSAAIHWNIPCLDVVIGREITECDVEEITVPDHSARFRRKGVKVHGCQLPLPANAVVSRNSIKVSSPELLFLEFARRLDMHRLILLGLQLCSYKPGQPSQALTTKQNTQSNAGIHLAFQTALLSRLFSGPADRSPSDLHVERMQTVTLFWVQADVRA